MRHQRLDPRKPVLTAVGWVTQVYCGEQLKFEDDYCKKAAYLFLPMQDGIKKKKISEFHITIRRYKFQLSFLHIALNTYKATRTSSRDKTRASFPNLAENNGAISFCRTDSQFDFVCQKAGCNNPNRESAKLIVFILTLIGLWSLLSLLNWTFKHSSLETYFLTTQRNKYCSSQLYLQRSI